MIDLNTSDGFYTQRTKAFALLREHRSDDLLNTFTISPFAPGKWAPYFLPFDDKVYAINLKGMHTYVVEDQNHIRPALELWQEELATRKRAPRTREEPVYICMPGLTVWTDRWVVSGPDECAWYVGRRIKYDDNFLESEGGSRYPRSVQCCHLPPSAVEALAG